MYPRVYTKIVGIKESTSLLLVTCQFKWWGLKGRVEKMIMNAEKGVFTKFHREVCCWIDQ